MVLEKTSKKSKEKGEAWQNAKRNGRAGKSVGLWGQRSEQQQQQIAGFDMWDIIGDREAEKKKQKKKDFDMFHQRK